ncbi:MAG: hypothetical protein LBJ46_06685 [Planctomycetota bacterium]|jgi:V/A-type H+-transporting ATPase subunit E|nr:hypothetical protein [Planctomycetota bacterium]
MSLDTIKTTVLDAAREKADAVLAGARSEAERIAAEAAAAGERSTAETVRDAKQRAERMTTRELERIQHDNRLQILRAKNDAINEVFKRVKDALAAMPDDDYVDLVGKWLGGLPAGVGGTLRVNPRDEAKFSARLDKLNRCRKGDGKFAAVVADPRIESGTVVEGPDFAVDCTFERRLGELRETAAGEVAKALFG